MDMIIGLVRSDTASSCGPGSSKRGNKALQKPINLLGDRLSRLHSAEVAKRLNISQVVCTAFEVAVPRKTPWRDYEVSLCRSTKFRHTSAACALPRPRWILKDPGLHPNNMYRMHPMSPCNCLQVGYCRMFLSGAASHAAFASVASGMARRQACAIKRQIMTCRWWRLLAFHPWKSSLHICSLRSTVLAVACW